jgi:hypothetical protein
MKEFKIRCSAISQIMTQPKTIKAREAGELSQTSKTYCENWYKEQLYSRKKEFTSKMTDKGMIMEDEAIDFVADHLNLGMLLKNEKYFSNEYMKGTPDVVLPKLVIDTKCSWDCFTFPLFVEKINPIYYWQGQGYMELTNKDNFKLIYVLLDTPAHLIKSEAWYFVKNNGYDELDEEMYQKFVDKMTYPNISKRLKIKIYSFARNNDDIAKIKTQVEKCRKYLKTIKI